MLQLKKIVIVTVIICPSINSNRICITTENTQLLQNASKDRKSNREALLNNII